MSDVADMRSDLKFNQKSMLKAKIITEDIAAKFQLQDGRSQK